MAKGSRDAARDPWIPMKALILCQLVSKAKGSLPGFVNAPTRNFCKVLINRFVLMGDEAEKKENTDRTKTSNIGRMKKPSATRSVLGSPESS